MPESDPSSTNSPTPILDSGLLPPRVRDDASLGDQWLTQVKKPRLMQRLVQIRLDVALRCAHRDYDAADLAWRDGITFIERSSSGTARERLKESWLEWQAEIQDRKAQQSIVLAETS
jgi:hypothetical protein